MGTPRRTARAKWLEENQRAITQHERDRAPVLAEIHGGGIQTTRYDITKPPACPCLLIRERCPGDPQDRNRPPAARSPYCAAGRRCLTGRDHLDAWYRDDELVAVVHYPYKMHAASLTEALAGCAELGLSLVISGEFSLHNPHRTLAVIVSRDGREPWGATSRSRSEA